MTGTKARILRWFLRGVIFFLLLALGTLGAREDFLQAPPGEGGGGQEPAVRALERDWGEIWNGTFISQIFTIENPGEQALRIRDVLEGHGVRVSSFAREIPPGGKGEVVLESGTRRSQGKIERRARVIFEDPDKAPIDLIVHARVKPSFDITPEPVVRFRIDKGASPSWQFRVSSPRKPDFAIRKVVSRSGKVRAEWSPVAKEGAEARGRVYRLTLVLAPDTPIGPLRDLVRIYTDLPDAYPGEIQLVGVVEGPLMCRPLHLKFQPGKDGAFAAARLSLSHREGRPFSVTGVESLGPDHGADRCGRAVAHRGPLCGLSPSGVQRERVVGGRAVVRGPTKRTAMPQKPLKDRHPRRPSGFTLIELLTVLAFIAFSAYLAADLLQGRSDRERENQTLRIMEEIRTALLGREMPGEPDVRSAGYIPDMGGLPELVKGQPRGLWTPDLDGDGVDDLLRRCQFMDEGHDFNWGYAAQAAPIHIRMGWRGPYLTAPKDGVLRDGWGHPLVFEADSPEKGDLTIQSPGPDGVVSESDRGPDSDLRMIIRRSHYMAPVSGTVALTSINEFNSREEVRVRLCCAAPQPEQPHTRISDLPFVEPEERTLAEDGYFLFAEVPIGTDRLLEISQPVPFQPGKTALTYLRFEVLSALNWLGTIEIRNVYELWD